MDDYRKTTSEELSREERIRLREERRLKGRARLDQRLSAKAVLVVFAFMLLVGVLLLVLPRPKTSSLEKRDLATFPKPSVSGLLSGSFTQGVMTFYDDTIPFRDTWKNANNTLKGFFGFRSKGNVELVGSINKVDPVAPQPEASAVPSPAASSTTDTTAAEATATSTPTPEPQASAAEDYSNSGFIILEENGHWRGLPLLISSMCESYTSFVNGLRAQTDPSVQIYAMPIPLASAYYLPEEYADYSADQEATFEALFRQLDDQITPVRLFNTLQSHKDEEIYLRTDHHWTMLGAYYACEKFASVANVPLSPLDSYAEIRREGYIGSIYGYTQSINILKDPEAFVLYIPSVPYESTYHDKLYDYQFSDDLFMVTDLDNSYMGFHGGDTYIIHTRTTVNNGRKLFILKDSYGNPLDALLTGSFEEIYSADFRFCDVNLPDFIHTMGITDVLIALDASNVASYSDDLPNLLMNYGGYLITSEEPELTPGPGSVSPYYKRALAGEDPLLSE